MKTGDSKFNFNNIYTNGVNLCTHIVYSSVSVNQENEKVYGLKQAQSNEKSIFYFKNLMTFFLNKIKI